MGELEVKVWGASLHVERGFGVHRPCWMAEVGDLGRAHLFPLTPWQQEERPIRQILYLGELLETCHFQSFWVSPCGSGGSLALQGW